MRRHLVAFGAMVALAALSFALSAAGVGGGVALLLSAAKAVLVLAVFMRLADGRPSATLGFLVAVLLLVTLVVGLAGDVLTR